MKKFITQKRINLNMPLRFFYKLIFFFAAITLSITFCLSITQKSFAQNNSVENSTIVQPSIHRNTKTAKVDFLVKYKTDLEAIESYLNNIQNLSARFTQKSYEGNAEGKFFLARPGKMRVEYIGEPKILIVVNGSVLSYKDIELDEVSNLSTNTTPASFLTRPNISFSAKDVEITNVVKGPESITVSLMKKNRTEAGEFSLTFKTSPALGFAKMQVKNDLGETTSITLQNVAFPENLDDDLFVIRKEVIQ